MKLMVRLTAHERAIFLGDAVFVESDGMVTTFTDEHSGGFVKSTKFRRPFKLVYFEACLNRKDAIRREIYLKTAWGKRYIKNRIVEYLKTQR